MICLILTQKSFVLRTVSNSKKKMRIIGWRKNIVRTLMKRLFNKIYHIVSPDLVILDANNDRTNLKNYIIQKKKVELKNLLNKENYEKLLSLKNAITTIDIGSRFIFERVYLAKGAC